MTRRSRPYIIADILDVAREGTIKTRIMYRGNLSFAQLNEYLSLCLDLNLLSISGNNPEGKTIYQTTSKGKKYLKHFREINKLLEKK
jgi:predicted transcriptional regulator